MLTTPCLICDHELLNRKHEFLILIILKHFSTLFQIMRAHTSITKTTTSKIEVIILWAICSRISFITPGDSIIKREKQEKETIK